ncbi:MAG: DNA-3-methyladenine glycosylase I [Candidatus Thermoplasmatota archaeon]|nr:DNA-3-methyladenine glycosylase I [Candidatus Thermoplasmatota archaeon]MCL6014390.1 DNA-3-methyladenine glycosylase I [Candidatus Thermoplasmatota archaeon]
MDELKRCHWKGIEDPVYQQYHDKEWGVPVHDDRTLFEALTLDGFQAGLSWITVLKKRENYRKAFDNFSAKKIATYDQEKIDELMNNSGIIRNRLKINSAITNASSFLKVVEEYGSFDHYIWSFVDGKTIKNRWQKDKEIPATSTESDSMSRDLRKRGFRFVGSTICYAFMQATGMINDHLIDCFRYDQL